MTIAETTHSIAIAYGREIQVYYREGASPKRGAVQITHGMGEHALRYRPVAQAIAARGYDVYANDHRGHGAAAARAGALGDFGPGGFPAWIDRVAKRVAA
jgi:alpha-beta hydrolase superfamily lysophospholipase